ncbi:hypothetical protein EHW99_3552 [Erwinia amylovora]|uniref:Uncharacterized protein n=1 Tax=Erwinia amylovora (strain CFBP1430) TaxID=665029 RepID=D4I3W1_ERWAC|nr:hypothetical protein EHX00_3552 [Erwinia amylovora]CBA23982.1 hypothetical protein predicted by Glimmer/Critica [Erwinia amylovora CFBP1430]QJQ59950.1 hypothetical protein EHW99_3552 [Erwinia amylovora]QJQ63649.1 hypothetical protein EHW98_3552 [Erwinia amylovora]QJQ67451.1 hypothetical protein EHW96_3552 [Erwinia amylovora]
MAAWFAPETADRLIARRMIRRDKIRVDAPARAGVSQLSRLVMKPCENDILTIRIAPGSPSAIILRACWISG